MTRYQLGDFATCSVQCRASDGAAASPTAAPQLTIYNAAGTAVLAGRKMPPVDKPTRTGLFSVNELLTGSYAAGWYVAYMSYAVSGDTRAALGFFEIAAGGDGSGGNLSLNWFPTPDSDWIVVRQEDGDYEFRRNPRPRT